MVQQTVLIKSCRPDDHFREVATGNSIVEKPTEDR
jgi:hypothetical protein